MAIKTYYVGSGQDGNFGALFDGVAQTAASRADGWTVGKIASALAADFDAATKQATGTFVTNTTRPSALITSATANAFKTPAALTGTFANTAWSFTFAVRATVLSAQAGRVRLRVYRSVNADGSAATEITGATQVGTTSAVLSTTADVTTVATWSPGAVTLNNEYLFFTLAWEITTASGSNTGDVVLRTGSTGPAGSTVVTPDFVPKQNVSVTGLSSPMAFGAFGVVITRFPQGVPITGAISPFAFGAVRAELNPPPVKDFKARWDASYKPSFTIPHTWGDANSWGAWYDRVGAYLMGGGDANGYYVPDYGPQKINGIEVASFTGGSAAQLPFEYGVTYSPPAWYGVPQTFFIVAQSKLVGNDSLWSANNYGPRLDITSGKLVWGDTYANAAVVTHPTSLVASQMFVAMSSFDGSTVTLRLNGVPATASYARGAWGAVGMVAQCANTSGAECLIAEVILFDRILSPAEIASMEAWLNSKWSPPPPQTVPVNGVLPAGTSFQASITGQVIVGDGHVVGGRTITGQFGTPTAINVIPAQVVTVSGRGTAQQFGAVSVKGSIGRSVTGLGSAQQFGSLAFRVTLGSGGVLTAQAFGTVTPKPKITQAITGVNSAQAFGAVTVKTVARPAAGGVPSAQAFGTVTASSAGIPQQVVPVPAVQSAQAFGAPVVKASIVKPTNGLGSAQAFGAVTPKVTIKAPTGGVPSAQQFGAITATVPAGPPQTVPVQGVNPYITVVSITGQVISGDGHLVGSATYSIGQFGAVSIHTTVTRAVGGVATAQQFGAPRPSNVYPVGGVGSAQQFGAPYVYWTQYAQPVAVQTAQEFGVAKALPGPVFRQVLGVPTAQLFGHVIAHRYDLHVNCKPEGGLTLPPSTTGGFVLTPITDGTFTLTPNVDQPFVLTPVVEGDFVLTPEDEDG